MTIRDALLALPSRADAEILLCSVLGVSRTWLWAHEDVELNAEQKAAYDSLSLRRKNHEPVAYLLNEQWFYARPFMVNSSTLIPRPATESLVDAALELMQGNTSSSCREVDAGICIWSRQIRNVEASRCVDVGAGSGCVGISIALEQPHALVHATEISQKAFEVAKHNAHKHHVEDRWSIHLGSLLEPLPTMHEPFVIVSNPPYIPTQYPLPADVQDFEPESALRAGPNGTDVLLPLLEQARKQAHCSAVAVECRSDQTATLDAFWDASF